MASGVDRRTLKAQRHADGKLRCAWCPEDPLYVAYHDTEWGVPVRSDPHLFEMLCLEGAQAGLSWITVLRKRETYRAAFDDFNADLMARYNAAKRRRLLQDPGIIRNRLKVEAFILNARAYLEIRGGRGSFSDYIWQFTDGKVLRRRPLHLGDIAASTPHSDAMSKDLKKKGFKFVGSTICHAFMQAVGIVDDINVIAGSPARNSLWAALLLLSLAAPGFAQAPKPAFKPLDVFDLQWVADPEVSPDARSIAYVRMAYDIKTDRPRGSIWLVGVDGKNERPLSSAVASGAPRWSPDGTRIAFLARAPDGSSQLFMYWTASGVAAAISNFTESPGALAWSPDGRWLAFTMSVPQERKPLKVELPEAPKNVKWADPPKLIDRMVFRADGEGYLPNTFSQLFIVSADGGAARQLTQGDFDHQGPPAFTADGSAVLISANRRVDADYDPLDSEIYRVDLSDGSIHALTDRRGPDRRPVASPDGKHIAYLGFDDKQLGYQATQLYVMDSDGSHSHSLTAALDRDAVSPRWLGDSKQIVFQYDDHGSTKIAAIDLSGKMRALADGVGGGDVTRPYSGGSFSIAPNGRFAFTKASATSPPLLATGTSARDITTFGSLSANLLGQRTLGALEEINFDSTADHRKMQGWIVKPPGFDPAKKYPFVLEIHGGPFAMYAPSFAAEIQLYAAAGYIVLYMNPRGSTGYGEEFGNLIHHDYPDKDYDDLMSGVDAVIGRGYIDTQRLFVTGGSGGGVLTAWIVGHTDRFRAAVVVKPVINWTSFVLTGDMNNFFYRYWFGEFPWDDMQAYWKRSPLAYVGNVKTPTMLMTGEVDYRTPSSEAEQFYQALKLRKIDTALVRVPNASHDISARPSLLIDKAAYVLAWFKAHDVKSP